MKLVSASWFSQLLECEREREPLTTGDTPRGLGLRMAACFKGVGR